MNNLTLQANYIKGDDDDPIVSKIVTCQTVVTIFFNSVCVCVCVLDDVG